MEVKTHQSHDASTNIFLTAAVVLANMDYSGLVEYAIKAAIGGIVWMGFKLTGDWIVSKMNNRKNKNK